MVVASPSSTDDGPLMLTVIGSEAEIVAVAEDAPLFKPTCEDNTEVIVPNVTVNPSDVSDNLSSVAVMVIVWVAPAELLAANVTVPDVADRSAPSAESVPNGADHPTETSAATDLDNVTVNDASEPSATAEEGPLIDNTALSRFRLVS